MTKDNVTEDRLQATSRRRVEWNEYTMYETLEVREFVDPGLHRRLGSMVVKTYSGVPMSISLDEFIV